MYATCTNRSKNLTVKTSRMRKTDIGVNVEKLKGNTDDVTAVKMWANNIKCDFFRSGNGTVSYLLYCT